MKAVAINTAKAGILNFFIVYPTLAQARPARDELHRPRSVEIGLFMVHPGLDGSFEAKIRLLFVLHLNVKDLGNLFNDGKIRCQAVFENSRISLKGSPAECGSLRRNIADLYIFSQTLRARPPSGSS